MFINYVRIIIEIMAETSGKFDIISDICLIWVEKHNITVISVLLHHNKA